MQTTVKPPETRATQSDPSAAAASGIAAEPVAATLAALRVDAAKGLTRSEVDERRTQHGYNEVAEQREHPVRRFLGKFWGISAWMLELIMVLSAFLRKISDLAIVGALLVINAILGFRRSAGPRASCRRCGAACRSLRGVLRDAVWQQVPARELVPGDVVRVRAGDIVPADLKLLAGTLSVDQSALTGESEDADKAPGEVLSSGPSMRRGEGNGVVLLTGAKTFFGRTTELVQAAHPKLHIEAVVAKVVRWLFVIVGAMLGVVVVLSLLRGVPLVEMLPLVLVLLMSAVPVALPVMFTVSMAVGSKELAGAACWSRGSAPPRTPRRWTCCASDKTGTITMNQLAVTAVLPLARRDRGQVLEAGALASQEAEPGPDRPGLPRRGRGAPRVRRAASGDAGLVRALRRAEPAHRSRGRAGRAAPARDEGRGAHRGRGLRPGARGDRRRWRRVSATRPPRATGRWRWRAARRPARRRCSGSSRWSIRRGRTPRSSSPSFARWASR